MVTVEAVAQPLRLTVWVMLSLVLTEGTWVEQPVTVKSLPARPVMASLNTKE